MAIGLRGVGPLVTTTTNSLTFTLPTGGSAPQAGDLIILHFGAGQDNPQPAYSSGLSGYAQRGSTLFLDYGPGGITQWIYWKVAGASESDPSVTINDGSDGIWGYAVVFSGVSTSSPFDLAAVSQNVESASSATFTPPSVATQTDGAWVVSFVQTSDDNTLAMSVAQSFTAIASGASYETTVGLDASFGSAYRLITSATTVTMPTWQQVNRSPDYWAWQTIGLKPSGPVTKNGSSTANAVKLKTQTPTPYTANAVKKKTQTGTPFTADAVRFKLVQPTFSANADIFGTVETDTSADAAFLRTWDVEPGFTADAQMVIIGEGDFSADAVLFDTIETDFSADAALFEEQAGSLTADALIFEAVETSFSADAALFWTYEPTPIPFDAIALETQVGSFDASSFILGWFTVDARIETLVTGPVWTTPADTVGISATPTLAFEMPDLGKAIHFDMQLDKVITFDGVDFREYKSNFDQTGWEYWDGGGWQAVPATGVPNAYAGNEARYTISDPLSSGTWYRRVRAG